MFSAKRHLKQERHYKNTSVQGILEMIYQSVEFSLGKKKAPKVQPRRLLSRKESHHYLEWLAELVECINSAHNPFVPG